MDTTLNRSLTNSQIYDGEFFEIVSNEGDILVVRYVSFGKKINILYFGFLMPCELFRCNICTPDGNDGQLLRTSVKSNGNILKHIKVLTKMLTFILFGEYWLFTCFVAEATFGFVGKNQRNQKCEIACTKSCETRRRNETVQEESGE